jgi:hypothetical protein
MRLVLIVAIWLMLLAAMARPHGRVVGDPLPGCHFNAHGPTMASPCWP